METQQQRLQAKRQRKLQEEVRSEGRGGQEEEGDIWGWPELGGCWVIRETSP